MPLLVWLLILLVSALAAFFASLLRSSAASGIGVFLILSIITGVFWYIFGPRRKPRNDTPHAPHPRDT